MPVKGPNNQMRGRLVFLTAMLAFLGFAAVGVRLFYMQVIDYKFYQSWATKNQTRDTVVLPLRGTIYDRNMKELAVSATTSTVSVTPKNVYDPLPTKNADGEKLTDAQKDAIKLERQQKAAKLLSETLELEYDDTLKKVQRDTSNVIIKRQVEKGITDKIETLLDTDEYKSVGGIYFSPDSKRYYNYGDFASHIIGFTDIDGNGLQGIEYQYNDILKGTSGRIVRAQNASGREMPFEQEKFIPAKDGDGVVLHIDEGIQHFLEKHLETVLADTGALYGVAGIVMEVKTGAVLGMATKPAFDLNNPREIKGTPFEQYLETMSLGDVQQKMWRNKAISDVYEPGSTFKLFTVSTALEEGIVHEGDGFYCGGSKTVSGWHKPIKCWKTVGHGQQTLAQTLQNSCNVAMMNIGERMGGDMIKKYFNAYNLNAKTGLDIPGEAKGIYFSHDPLAPSDVATASFGQSISATPIEMINMVCTIVDDGRLKVPQLFKEVVDTERNVKQTNKPEVLRQVISEVTSEKMRNYMQWVVELGTGQNAYVAGYRVGGKTATTEKLPRNQGKYIASFIGVAPMDDPEIAVLVMVDEPQCIPNGGGAVAAPVVGRIMADALPYLGIEPKYEADEMDRRDISVPNVIGEGKDSAATILKGKGISFRTVGNGDKVTDQLPSGGVKVPATSEIVLYLGGERSKELVTVPKVTGLSVSQANAALKNVGLYMKRMGVSSKRTLPTTRAVKQSPIDTKVAPGTVITVEFDNNVSSRE